MWETASFRFVNYYSSDTNIINIQPSVIPELQFGKDLNYAERKTFFGYNDLVVDMRSLPVMRKQIPVLFDATHSVQRPSSNHGISGGDRNLIPYLASGAVIIGADGLYMEVYPCPEKTLSDGAVQFPLSNVENLWREILEVRALQVKLDSRP